MRLIDVELLKDVVGIRMPLPDESQNRRAEILLHEREGLASASPHDHDMRPGLQVSGGILGASAHHDLFALGARERDLPFGEVGRQRLSFLVVDHNPLHFAIVRRGAAHNRPVAVGYDAGDDRRRRKIVDRIEQLRKFDVADFGDPRFVSGQQRHLAVLAAVLDQIPGLRAQCDKASKRLVRIDLICVNDWFAGRSNSSSRTTRTTDAPRCLCLARSDQPRSTAA